MHAILFVLGLVATAMGAAMVGYGIPINEFSLGNTLIIAGTVSLTGGLLLIGLAATVRQLRTIANALSRPVNPRAAQPAEPVEQPVASAPHSDPPPVRIPEPSKQPAAAPEPELPREPRLNAGPQPGAEPRIGVPRETGEAGSASRRMPKFTPLARLAEPPVVDESDDAPLSPFTARASGRPARPQSAPDLTATRRDRPSSTNGSALPPAEPRVDAPWRPSKDAQQPGVAFDSLWPTDRRAPSPGEKPPSNPPLPAVTEPASSPAEDAPADAVSAPQPVSILKSGVVDGMAYTLYADGSIEAQLPQGTVRFGSINELRTHIEDNS